MLSHEHLANIRRDLVGWTSSEVLDKIDVFPRKITFIVSHCKIGEVWKDEDYVYDIEIQSDKKTKKLKVTVSIEDSK